MKKENSEKNALTINAETTYLDMASADFAEAEFCREIIMAAENNCFLQNLRAGSEEDPLPPLIRTCAVKYADAAEKYVKVIIQDYIKDTKYAKFMPEDKQPHGEIDTANGLLTKHKIWRILKYVERHFPDYPLKHIDVYGTISKAHQSFGYPLDTHEIRRNKEYIIDTDTIEEFRPIAEKCKEMCEYICENYEKNRDGEIVEVGKSLAR